MAAIFIVVSSVFNVGFFYGIGINYFTLFSIQDHILFSIEYTPIILSYTILLILASLCVMTFYQSIIERTGYISSRKKLRALTIIAAITGLLFLFCIKFFLGKNLNDLIVRPSALIFLTLFPIPMLLSITPAEDAKNFYIRIPALLAFSTAFFIASYFALGVSRGALLLYSDDKAYDTRINDSIEPVLLLRAGESGALFLTRTGRIIFLSDDRVTKISRRTLQ